MNNWDALYKVFAGVSGVIYLVYTAAVLRNRQEEHGYTHTQRLQSLSLGFCGIGLLVTKAFVPSSARLYVVLALGTVLIASLVAHVFFIRVPPDDDKHT